MATAQIIDVIFRGRNDADAAIRGVEQGLAGVDKAGEGIDRVGRNLDGIGTRLSTIGPALAAAFGIASVANFGAAFVSANVELERFTLAVTQIRGDSTLASRELDYLRTVSERLGLSVRETSSAYVSLLAATKGTALEGQQTRDIFEAVARSMALLGRSSADTEGALLAIQQIISKGTVSSEELRGQLGERLPGAFQIAARAVGVTTQELGKMLEQGQVIAEDFLPKFTQELNNTFGDTGRVDTYTAALNRLKNQFDETLQTLGSSGLFDLLTDSLSGAGKATEAVGGGISYLSTVAGAFFNVLRGGSLEVFSAELDIAAKRADDVTVRLSGGLNETLAETARLSRQAAEATSGASQAQTDELTRQANASAAALKEVGDAFKTLGVNPEKIRAEVSKVLDAFDTLSSSDSVSGGQLLAGLESVLKRIDDAQYLPRLRDNLQQAFDQGRITSDELARGMALVAKEQEGLDKKLGLTTKSIDDQTKASERAAKEAERAAEKQQQFRLELEKLASNERIKNIEASVKLNVAQVEADTARIKAAFDSLDNSVASTADVINKSFGVLAGLDNNSQTNDVRNKLFDQLDRENEQRGETLRQQRELTQAQIRVLEAQARQLDGGNALIQVDGSGLKPHLEAIMWELLKAIQVRTNRDGLNLLLGVS